MYDAGEVYISKKVDVYDLLDSGDDDKLMKLVEEETVMHFKSTDFTEQFIKDLKWDLAKLKYLTDMWTNISFDPKLEQFVGFLFTEKFFMDIINMTYSCRVVLDMICMECGNYEDR